jgi:preprotein translocase subunit SecG
MFQLYFAPENLGEWIAQLMWWAAIAWAVLVIVLACANGPRSRSRSKG